MADNQDLRDRLRLKYIPFGATLGLIAKAETFLSLSDDQQASILEFAFNEDAEFYISLLTARALYQDPVDKQDGSITDAKVAAHPERYK